MPRQPSEYRAAHAAANAIEPRLARAFRRSAEKLQASVSINALAMAIAAKDVKAALRILSGGTVEDALSPCRTIVRDSFLKGGRLGAEQLTKALA